MKLIATQAENTLTTSSKTVLQRLFALLVVAVLCCVPLAGCANNSNSADSKADTPSATQTDNAAQDTSATTAQDTSATTAEDQAKTAEEAALTEAEDATEITVSVEVTGSFEGTTVDSKGEYTVAAGSSALDALQATDLDVTVEDSQYGAYVTSVDGLTAEGSNGWLYSVNGESPTVSAGDYTLADGDTVVWSFYVAE